MGGPHDNHRCSESQAGPPRKRQAAKPCPRSRRYDPPTARRAFLRPTQGRKIGSDPYDDPTQGRRIGSESYDDPTQGRKSGSEPYDDPTQGRKSGSDPYGDPTRAR